MLTDTNVDLNLKIYLKIKKENIREIIVTNL